ncbi:polysaccharide deacetylase family protein, partial [Halochromatium roseum]|uniref:polysaccharide deacetylase family protein n=1 Tax=Halochromatium roseum TaxID=391920 RepID=UPI0019129805
DILLTDPRLPILYGDADTSPGPGRAAEQGDRIDLPLDVFGAAFFMLSRYEEAVLPDRDNHDRFPATASLAQRAGFLDRPIIDEYVETLWTALHQRWPSLQRKPRQARTLVSCDVDSPFAFNAGSGSRERLATEEHGRTRKGQEAPFPWTSVFFRGKTTAAAGYRLARGLAADLLKRRSPSLAWRNLRGQWRARRGDYSLDPHRLGLEHIMDLNERASRAVAFYFIPENTHPKLDNRVSLDDPRLRALLRQIHARGHEIGLHPGYNSYRHPEAMTRSVQTLRRVLDEEGIDQPQLGGRQHYLRWETPTTARLWDDNGLDYDSTLSYADRPGFRCGTCREYPLYDLQQRRPLRLRERPLIVMECSVIAERYLGLGYSDQALALMQHYRDTCHRFGGDFTLLWHNSHLGSGADRRFYAALVGENAADVASLTH